MNVDPIGRVLTLLLVRTTQLVIILDRGSRSGPGIVKLDWGSRSSPGVVKLDRGLRSGPGMVNLDRRGTFRPSGCLIVWIAC